MGALIPIEPDHLCSLIALNASVDRPWTAFVGGLKWGLGHSLGMLAFCVVFLPLQRLIDVAVWEHYGNYLAGALLMAIGMYFLVYESRYLEIKDGKWVAKDSCDCCPTNTTSSAVHYSHAENAAGDGGCSAPPQLQGEAPPRRQRHRANDVQKGLCHSACCSHNQEDHRPDVEQASDAEAEKKPLLSAKEVLESERFMRFEAAGDLRGALVGLVQGLCCPSCIAGLAFVGQMGAQNPNGFEIMCFFVICFLSVIFCSAFISVGVVTFQNCVGFYFSVSTRTLFRFACLMSIAFGSIWIGLTYWGKLHVIQYTDAMEMTLHDMAKRHALMALEAVQHHS